jgi:hypothetical protein
MPKPISVILQGQEILSTFTDYDTAVREFKSLTPNGAELSLHVLNRPDRRKGKALVLKMAPQVPRVQSKRNKESLI